MPSSAIRAVPQHGVSVVEDVRVNARVTLYFLCGRNICDGTCTFFRLPAVQDHIDAITQQAAGRARADERADLAGVLGVHEEGWLLHDVMPHHDDEVSMTDCHMDVVTIADGCRAHVLRLPCT
jgi:hypothetical protein